MHGMSHPKASLFLYVVRRIKCFMLHIENRILKIREGRKPTYDREKGKDNSANHWLIGNINTGNWKDLKGGKSTGSRA